MVHGRNRLEERDPMNWKTSIVLLPILSATLLLGGCIVSTLVTAKAIKEHQAAEGDKKSDTAEEPKPQKGASKMESTVMKEPFGPAPRYPDALVYLYTLKNGNGMTVKVTNYGGIVTSILVPSRSGATDDVVLGFNRLEDYTSPEYEKSCPYFGAIIGRFANRVANGTFTLDGKTYSLAKNNGPNSLHGGLVGFDKYVWNSAEFKDTEGGVGVRLSRVSKDGEEGYPGNLSVTVTYTLTEANELKIKYEAATDKATPVCMTSHGYFNLAGAGNGDILGHELYLNAARYTVINENMIPTGELKDVRGTDLDFTTPTAIGQRIGKVPSGGYDFNYVINKGTAPLSLAARVSEPKSGRTMEVWTTEPGVQLYTGNFLDGTFAGKGGQAYKKWYGLSLETQHFPDSPNHPEFPSTILRPGEKLSDLTVYKFGW
jgi:aldose 1-epimerase